MDQTFEKISGILPETESPAVVPFVLWQGGQRRDLVADEGEKLMIVLKRAGLPLQAVCGGKGACGTCKVAFAPVWAGRLSQAEQREQRLLTHLGARQGERLACRIHIHLELEGLEVFACD